MASSRAIHYGDKKTKELMMVSKKEKPVAIQIFGSEPDIMAEAAVYASQFGDIIDINMGCPAPKVVKNGDGSKLLLNPKLIGEIVYEVSSAINRPVTVKIRKGWDSENINCIEIAKIVEKNGAKAITIHGRTRQEYYSGTADWDIIKQVKNNVNIPVIGNGDIKSEENAKQIFEDTNIDGIMIGRAILGNPWLFRSIIHFLKTGEKLEEINDSERLYIILKHLDLAIKNKGEYIGLREMRKHISWYLKGLENSSKIRDEVNRIEDLEILKNQLVTYFN